VRAVSCVGAVPAARRLRYIRQMFRVRGALVGALVSFGVTGAATSAQDAARNGRIAFVVAAYDYTDAPKDIFAINADGTGERNLTRTPKLIEWSPVWSPNGQKLGFNKTASYSDSQVSVMNAAGRDRRTLTGGAYSYMGSWSPDGRRIAYTRLNGGQDKIGRDTSEIYVMNADGSGKRRLTRNKAIDDAAPSWSPDGGWILFTRGGDVYVMRPDGREQRRVTHTRDSSAAGWSPDGRRILFSRSARDLGSTADGIYVINADGTGRTRLTRGVNDYSPTWSPDGRWVLISRQSQAGAGIYVIAPDGASRRRLTRKVNDLGATWSPDGRKIAFGRGSEIWVMNRDGSGIHRVTRRRGHAEHASPVWAPS
jgi:tol-pal system beta propeller repeat protein TolB